jgi:hypothetical protein
MLTVPLLGGSLARLGDIQVRALWSVSLAMLLQLVIINVLERALPHVVASGLHIASYALAGWFVYANRRIRGLWIVALGGALNVIAIAANNGVMPASPGAVRRAGLVSVAEEFSNSAATPNARVAFLGDVFAIPKSWPMANVFSVGDVVLIVGLGVVVHVACGSRLRRRSPDHVDEPISVV